MYQALVKEGKVVLDEVPTPIVKEGFVLIRTLYSCISSGTELSGLKFSSETFVDKAMRTTNTRKIIQEKLKQEGLGALVKMVTSKRKEHQSKQKVGNPTGYSISGIVIDVGKGVEEFEIGDNVAAAGMGYAQHAEFVAVPKNLVIKSPPGLSPRLSSTVTIGGIALQSVRRADLQLGEFAVVYGTGLLGLIICQLLISSGVRVAAIDIDDNRLAMANKFGCEITVNSKNKDYQKEIGNWTLGHGVDAVLFAANTKDHQPLSDSFNLARKKGKVIMVGVGGNTVKRSDMYKKELDYLLSTSYGPGRYDPFYEEEGNDYPYAYVRWTEKRNMAEYLRLIEHGNLDIESLISGTYEFTRVAEAFDLFKNDTEKPITIILQYPIVNEPGIPTDNPGHRLILSKKPARSKSNILKIGLIGTGYFATARHLPNLMDLDNYYSIHALADMNSVNLKVQGTRFDAKYVTTNYADILQDEEIDLVMICTRHENHGEMVIEAINHGKHVFVEKPLAVERESLNSIESIYANSDAQSLPLIMVGFNRRFSKVASGIKHAISERQTPLVMYYRMNVGFIEYDSWVHKHGGRIVGEACHIIDLMSYLTDAKIVEIGYISLGGNSEYLAWDNKTIQIKYSDGSIGTMAYFSTGSDRLDKEYLEIHCDRKSILMKDYKEIKSFGWDIKAKPDLSDPKGHREELVQLHKAITNPDRPWPISLESMLDTTRATLSVTRT